MISPNGANTHNPIGIMINIVKNGTKIERNTSGECFLKNLSI